jgi:hypothetical protein
MGAELAATMASGQLRLQRGDYRMAKAHAIRRNRFERLEQRHLLAGDVLVEVVNGVLMLDGDALDNKIMVADGAEADSFVVTGLDGTTVHMEGQTPASQLTVTGVQSARVDLVEGNDLFALVGANLSGFVAVDMGSGNDRAFIGTSGNAPELVGRLPTDLSVSVGESLRVSTAAGNDRVSVDNAMLGGRLSVNAGANDDIVSLGVESTTDLSTRVDVGGFVHVNLSDGNDDLNMHQLDARLGIFTRGGSGNNVLDASRIENPALFYLGGAGIDTVALTELDAAILGIHTAAGNDRVDVRDSAFAALGVSLGDGDDVLTTSALNALIAAMDGGNENDTLTTVGESNFMYELIQRFETPMDVNMNGFGLARGPLGSLFSMFE